MNLKKKCIFKYVHVHTQKTLIIYSILQKKTLLDAISKNSLLKILVYQPCFC